MTYVHGLTESQAVQEAAQELSRYRNLETLEGNQHNYNQARLNYDLAFLRYTDPFHITYPEKWARVAVQQAEIGTELEDDYEWWKH